MLYLAHCCRRMGAPCARESSAGAAAWNRAPLIVPPARGGVTRALTHPSVYLQELVPIQAVMYTKQFLLDQVSSSVQAVFNQCVVKSAGGLP